MNFDCHNFNRHYLERLTTHELLTMAEYLSLDIPPELERVFVIEELINSAQELDLFNDETNEEHEEIPASAKTDTLTAVPLPKQYNITFMDILIRDPLWVFVFWEVKMHDREIFERDPDFEGYYLKVSPVPDSGEGAFTVAVGATDSAWYLSFPPAGGTFQIELCARSNQEEVSVVNSGSFTMPCLFGTAGSTGDKNPLITLSGVERMQILRKVDRIARTRSSNAR
jgi:hypothetical protein